jgi:hypothetical protein
MENSILNRNTTYIKEKPRLSRKRQLILDVLKQSSTGLTSLDIVRLTKMPINQVSGRLSELKQMFYISGNGSMRSHYTGNYLTIWRVCNNDWRIYKTNKAFVELRKQKDHLISDKYRGVSTYTLTLLKKEIKKIDNLITKLT